jgi:hypothetical protein
VAGGFGSGVGDRSSGAQPMNSRRHKQTGIDLRGIRVSLQGLAIRDRPNTRCTCKNDSRWLTDFQQPRWRPEYELLSQGRGSSGSFSSARRFEQRPGAKVPVIGSLRWLPRTKTELATANEVEPRRAIKCGNEVWNATISSGFTWSAGGVRGVFLRRLHGPQPGAHGRHRDSKLR